MAVTAPTLPDFIARQLPAGTQRSLVDVGEGVRLHVMQRGAGRPVLMLHGNPSWSFLYRKVADALGDDAMRVVLPDLAGLGYSDRVPPAEHTIAGHARRIGALIDALDLRDLIFVGQDWGGPIGLLALAERPERVAGLVVLNTVLGPPRPGFRPTLFHRLSQAPLLSQLLFRWLDFPQRVLWLAQGDRGSIAGDVARAYLAPLREDNAAVLALARMVPDSLQHHSVGALERVRDYVARFDKPAAIVWGQRDPVLGKLLRRISRALPDAPVTRTQGGHFLPEEFPEEIAAAVRDVAARAALS